MADPTEKPLANAEILFTTLKLTARSDSAGNFAISGVPAGRYEVAFRLLGYEAITTMLNFLPGQKLEGDFLLKPLTTTLAKVEVKGTATSAPASLAMVEFEERRKRGGDRFLTQDVLEKNENRLMTDLLFTKLPGLHANALCSSGRAIASGRSTVGISTETAAAQAQKLDKLHRDTGNKINCYLQILVNGVIMYQAMDGRPLFDINTVNPSTVAGIEFYTTAQTPPQYQSTGSQCGTILIWTRARCKHDNAPCVDHVFGVHAVRDANRVAAGDARAINHADHVECCQRSAQRHRDHGQD